MKVLSLVLFLSVSALIPAATMAQAGNPDSSSIAQDLLAKSGDVHALRQSKNFNALKLLLADDFEGIGSEGRLHGRDEMLDDGEDSTLRAFKLYDPKVVQIDSTSALVTYNLILEMREGDEPGMAPRYQKVSDLWVRQGEEWRLKFEQATPLRPID